MTTLNLTKALKKANVPALYSTEEVPREHKMVQAVVFDPGGRGTWYVIEWDGKDTVFCFCKSPLGSDCDELGYASVSELEAVTNRFRSHLKVADPFKPRTLGDLLE